MNISKSFFAAALFSTSVSSLAFAEELQPIRIGVMGPITGGAATNGEMMRDAAFAFAKYTNEHDRVLGRPLEIVLYDDACSPKDAVSVANKIIGDQIDKVVGPFCTGAAQAARDTFKEAGIVNITLAQMNAVTSPEHTGLFRITPPNRDLTPKIIEDLSRTKTGSVAIYAVEDAYGKELRQLAHDGLSSSNLQVMSEGFSTGDKDHAHFATKIINANVDVVFLAIGATDIGNVARQLRNNNYTGTIVTPGTGTLADYAATVTCPMVDGSIAIAGYDKTYKPENAYIVKALQDAGTEARDNIIYTWGALQVFRQAIELGQSDDPAIVQKMIGENIFDTAMGRLDFITYGNFAGNIVNPDIARYVWKCDTGVAALHRQ